MGSISAVANAMGGVSERHRYDPWGRPRATVDWSAITDGTWFAMNREETATSKGFTGHEMLDQVGIIHMGGRIYDPTLGRFMSADPVVKGLDNTESYNRYSYVRNSPMSYTDPSGYSWLSDAWDDITDFVKDHILEVAVAIVSPQVGLLGVMAAGYGGRELARFAARNQYGGEVLGLIGTAVCSFATGGTGAAGCVTKFQGFSSMAIARENGASIGQSLVAGVSSAALAGANIGIAGKIAGTGSNFAVSGALHGMRGGILAGLSGSDARSGLIGGATEGMFGDWIQDWADNDTPGGSVLAGFLSGSVSQVTGGKFAVGAATGAMGYLFNQANRSAQEKTSISLGYTEASGHGAHGQHHAFVVATDPISGEQYITRAGPTMSMFGVSFSGGAVGSSSAASGSGGGQQLSGSGFGYIQAQTGIWSESLSFDKPSQTLYMQNVGSVNMSYKATVRNMGAYAAGVNSRSIAYWPLGPNSNSYAFSYIQNLGFDRPVPAFGAPGWDKDL